MNTKRKSVRTTKPAAADPVAALQREVAALRRRLDLIEGTPEVRRAVHNHQRDEEERRRQQAADALADERRRDPKRLAHFSAWADARLAIVDGEEERIDDLFKDFSTWARENEVPIGERVSDDDFPDAFTSIGVEVGEIDARRPHLLNATAPGAIGARLLREGEDAAAARAEAADRRDAAQREREERMADHRAQNELDRRILDRHRDRENALIEMNQRLAALER